MRNKQTLVATVILVGAGAAEAHAHLRSATPPVNSSVSPPQEVAITDTEGVEPRFSSIEVKDAAGTRVDKRDPHTAPEP